MEKQPKWIEVWIETNDYRFLLVLKCYSDNRIELTDPQAGHSIIETFSAYDDANIWLIDDEYSKIGRFSLED